MRTLLDSVRDHKELSILGKLIENVRGELFLTHASPLTFFAPTNQAFQQLPLHLHLRLLNDIGQMSLLLHQHLVPARIEPVDLLELKKIFSLAGDALEITFNHDLKINNIRLTGVETQIDNGVLYTIDRLLFWNEFSQACSPQNR